MASKKYSFLAGVFCLLVSYGFAQTTTTTGSGYSVSDSSVVPARRMPQHTEFMNGTYSFPAKPRNQWEVGVKAGLFTISGDVTALPSYGVGAHIRKAFGYLFSGRLSYMQGIGKGLNYNRSFNYHNNIAWADRYREGTDPVFYNYKTIMHDLSLEGILTLNNVRFHKAKSGFNIYALGGVGGMIYKTRVNAVNDGGNAANVFGPNYLALFNSVQGGQYKDRKETKDALKDGLDDTYETLAENHGGRRPTLRGNTFRPVAHVGAGFQFKINNKINIALEDRFSIAKDDLLDGQRWSEQVNGNPVLTRDYDTYNHLTLGLNVNLGAKGTEPLWWVNPLDYAYSEIRNPRLMRLPKPVLPDTDGDGITDQFDQEQTPAGVPVDSKGVSRDTDGDGVPDARDKELITPTSCQPVDADGVGKCPVICPDSTCAGWVGGAGACEASLGALPSITFSSNTSVSLSADARSMLTSVAGRLRNSPNCRIVVTGYCASSKSEQQRSWDRVNVVINHLVEKEGISADRLIFNYGQEGGDCNTIDLRAATNDEQGQGTVPAPHPNLRRK